MAWRPSQTEASGTINVNDGEIWNKFVLSSTRLTLARLNNIAIVLIFPV